LLPVVENKGCSQYTHALVWPRCPAFFVNRGDGMYGTGAVEATSLITLPDGSVRIFASGFLVDHSLLTVQQAAGTPATNLLVYETADLDRLPGGRRMTED
jgi:hypothetical protein